MPRELHRIAFIVPRLEPGRCGVGDYARRLSEALNLRQIETLLVSVNDEFVSVRENDPRSGQIRLPAHSPPAENYLEALQELKRFQPDWISLQYVGFSYERKGLPVHMRGQFQALNGIAPLHMMFHELWWAWEGFSPRNVKNWMHGIRQRKFLAQLVTTLAPRKIHTQSTVYQEKLKGIGITAELLSLFGNIPLARDPLDKAEFFRKYLQETPNADTLLFCSFGTVHPQWDFDHFRDRISTDLRRVQKKGVLFFLGSTGLDKEKVLGLKGNNELQVCHTGSLPEHALASFFSNCDFGVTSYPPDLLEKSGATASMFEHGLRVISTRPPHYNNQYLQKVRTRLPGLIIVEDLGGWETKGRLPPETNRLMKVAEMFLRSLQQAS